MEQGLEILGVVLNMVFLIGIMYRKKWCWPFGILGSALGMIQMYLVHLYSESILYSIYFAFGFYGWWVWSKEDEGVVIVERKPNFHFSLIGFGLLFSSILGYFMRTYTDASLPFLDATTTTFGLIATWLEARKVLSSWYYWIVLNGISIWMYNEKEIPFYAALMVLYTILSVVSLYKWRSAYLNQAY